MAKDNGIKDLYIHAFLDGRDVTYNTAKKYLNMLENNLKKNEIGKIANVEDKITEITEKLRLLTVR